MVYLLVLCRSAKFPSFAQINCLLLGKEEEVSFFQVAISRYECTSSLFSLPVGV
jgi:hypothetical protein